MLVISKKLFACSILWVKNQLIQLYQGGRYEAQNESMFSDLIFDVEEVLES